MGILQRNRTVKNRQVDLTELSLTVQNYFYFEL